MTAPSPASITIRSTPPSSTSSPSKRPQASSHKKASPQTRPSSRPPRQKNSSATTRLSVKPSLSVKISPPIQSSPFSKNPLPDPPSTPRSSSLCPNAQRPEQPTGCPSNSITTSN